MEKDGLVKKIRENPKSALKRFELTEKGLDTYLKCNKEKSINDIMSVLSEEELKQLILMLEKMTNKAQRYKGAKSLK